MYRLTNFEEQGCVWPTLWKEKQNFFFPSKLGSCRIIKAAGENVKEAMQLQKHMAGRTVSLGIKIAAAPGSETEQYPRLRRKATSLQLFLCQYM